MRIKKIFWRLLLVVSMLSCIAATIYIVLYFFSGVDEIDYLKHGTSDPNQPGAFSTNINYAENHNIDWDKIREESRDLYAWIYIPNTSVDYIVAQAPLNVSDDFYLNHNSKKQYEFAGTIYSEKVNARDFSDPVTVLYGHNMLNGSMFATLHRFEDSSFFKKNKYMYIYMPKRKLTYKIYAAYVYDDRHIINSFDFSKKKVLKKYLKSTQNPDSMTKNTRKVDLDTDSKILTLSTCTNGAENTRYLVQGVLIKDERTN